MNRKAEITETEWLQALEEVRPTAPPPGAKSFNELMELWHLKECRTSHMIQKLTKAGSIERMQIGKKWFFRLLKPAHRQAKT
jgi:hypothetical protein